MAVSNRHVRGATRPEVLHPRQARAHRKHRPQLGCVALLPAHEYPDSARILAVGVIGLWGGQFWVLEFRLCASPTFNDTLPEVDTDGKLP